MGLLFYLIPGFISLGILMLACCLSFKDHDQMLYSALVASDMVAYMILLTLEQVVFSPNYLPLDMKA